MTAVAFENHLVVYARAPRLGRVKSRLARDIGVVAAWRFYRLTLAETLRRLDGGGRWRCWLAVTPDAAIAAPWPAGWTPMAQHGGDLGQRMQRTMGTLPPGPAIIVGTDVPGLRADHVTRAFRALGSHDAVFGPAADGGYWLVGLARRPRIPRLFSGVRWSTRHALADTLAHAGDLDVELLETLADIDTAADLQRAAQPAATSEAQWVTRARAT